MIKVEKLKMPEGPIPQIDFGEDFENDFDDARKIRYLKKLSSAMNHATDLIQQERNQLLKDIQVAVKSVEHADEAVAIQKDIVIKAITNHNADKQNLIKRIQELETENKSLSAQLRKYED